mmetsp:Transcript_2526/g.7241  ORF Transcript_2526/g.7241 Transcript_2526/m.7241 type:complete len:313 (-) Transcript_2526:1260-2198(-)
MLLVRHRRGKARGHSGHLHHRLWAQGSIGRVLRARERRSARPCDGLGEESHEVGRGSLRLGVRPRHLQHCRRERLQCRSNGEQGLEPLQRRADISPTRYRHRRGLRVYRERRRPRVLPQLDRESCHLPRLVPVDVEGGFDGLPRSGVLGRHGQRGGEEGRGGALVAGQAVFGRWRADGAPHSSRELHRDGQLLHGHGLLQGRRGDSDVPDLVRPGGLPEGHGPLLQAARRLRGVLRRLPHRDGGRQRPRPHPVRGVVSAAGHSAGGGSQRVGRREGDLHAALEAEGRRGPGALARGEAQGEAAADSRGRGLA